ncbi:hypothetical protein PACTADRAFT_76632 [Pachysolen tannophilus NRRL Y-2460]|uniref:Uncharacterized protein n=1 Tax=Pachysolen tannophilus NRRL Y-2460 TaxID=669874 RepID=A0A1E4TTJ0_PACTA|nr:hypothetical protein PACTADRAFT_76632 [Pachysolen tannophilus NRRL Y-2460]
MNNNRSSNNLEQQLTDTSSVISDISLLTTNTEQESFISNSVFSNDLSSISTANTSVNQESIIGSGSNNGNGNGKQLVITLEEALPSNFQDMYSPDTLIDVLPNGRPKFTKRDIIDWELNDIRALLIVDSLEPNWNNQIPVISSRENIFKIQYLPLDSSDNRIIQTLVESDIYRETNFHINFRVKSATYIVKTARQRHVRMLKDLYHIQDDLRDTELANTPFLRYELRNIVENFLLNLGVESQCRSDFKKNCSVVKKQKRQLYGLDNMMFIDDDGTVSNRSDAKTLLKKAIINSANNCGSVNVNRNNMTFKLSQEEKAKLWYDVQLNIYRRLELDWQPDNIR